MGAKNARWAKGKEKMSKQLACFVMIMFVAGLANAQVPPPYVDKLPIEPVKQIIGPYSGVDLAPMENWFDGTLECMVQPRAQATMLFDRLFAVVASHPCLKVRATVSVNPGMYQDNPQYVLARRRCAAAQMSFTDRFSADQDFHRFSCNEPQVARQVSEFQYLYLELDWRTCKAQGIQDTRDISQDQSLLFQGQRISRLENDVHGPEGRDSGGGLTGKANHRWNGLSLEYGLRFRPGLNSDELPTHLVGELALRYNWNLRNEVLGMHAELNTAIGQPMDLPGSDEDADFSHLWGAAFGVDFTVHPAIQLTLEGTITQASTGGVLSWDGRGPGFLAGVSYLNGDEKSLVRYGAKVAVGGEWIRDSLGKWHGVVPVQLRGIINF